MKVLSDPQRLLNLNLGIIYFAPAPTVNADVKRALRQLNKYQGFTRGIFKFETVERQAFSNDVDVPELISTINRYNMIVRLVDDSTDDYKYAVGKVNFNLSYSEVELTIQKFIVEVCKLNAKHIETYLKDQSAEREITAEQRANLKQMRQIFLDAVSMKNYRHGIWARLMGDGAEEIIGPVSNRLSDGFERKISPEMREKLREVGKAGDIDYILSWCEDFFGSPDKRTSNKIAKDYYSGNYKLVRRGSRVETKPDVPIDVKIEIRKIGWKIYGRSREVYGIVITVEGEEFVVYIGSKDQLMLYICTLLRTKMGKKLYKLEFFINEDDIARDTDTVKWFSNVYHTIYPPKTSNPREFDKWIKKEWYDNEHRLNQAVSQSRNKILKILEKWPEAINKCEILTKSDKENNTFYHFGIAPENIIIPEEMQPLLDDFYDIMQIDKPE